MKCPYCDDSIHPMAKFCPKCGLPVKEDATVMGVYTTDDGPNPWVIGAGALGIVLVALSIGWMNSHKDGGRTQVVRRSAVQTASAYPAPAAPAVAGMGSYGGLTNGWGSYGAFNFGRTSSRTTGPSANYNPQVNWAFKPDQVPNRDNSGEIVRRHAAAAAEEAAVPPPNMDTLSAMINARPRPHVSYTVPTTPPAPVTPQIPPVPVYTNPGDSGLDAGVNGPYSGRFSPTSDPGQGQASGQGQTARAQQDPTQDTWEWDPVQERWARRPGLPHAPFGYAVRQAPQGR